MKSKKARNPHMKEWPSAEKQFSEYDTPRIDDDAARSGRQRRRSQSQMERGKAEANRQRQTGMDEEIPPNLWTVFALQGMRAAPMKGRLI